MLEWFTNLLKKKKMEIKPKRKILPSDQKELSKVYEAVLQDKWPITFINDAGEKVTLVKRGSMTII